jgi:hypothetical protein
MYSCNTFRLTGLTSLDESHGRGSGARLYWVYNLVVYALQLAAGLHCLHFVLSAEEIWMKKPLGSGLRVRVRWTKERPCGLSSAYPPGR